MMIHGAVRTNHYDGMALKHARFDDCENRLDDTIF